MLKTILRIFTLIVILFVFFYILLVIPNDRRTALSAETANPVAGKFEQVYAFSALLPEAVIYMPEAEKARAVLDAYPYKQSHPASHSHPLNLNLSLGWFPLKTDHQDCIFAPAPSSLEFSVKLPENPVLKFNTAVLPRPGSKIQAPVSFTVTLIDRSKAEHILFDKAVKPLKAFPWRYYDGFYKNFYKYLFPKLADREGVWNTESIDLSAYGNQAVVLRFSTAGENAAPAFWGQPRLLKTVAKTNSKNILLIVIDSFRYDSLNPETSPALWKLSGESVNFENALSNGNMTKLSVSSFLTSRYPFEIPEVSMQYELSQKDKEAFYSRRVPTLAGALRARGYRTAAIGSVSLFSDGHGLSADLGFAQAINLEHSGYSPPHVTRSAMEWLKDNGNEKFFLLLYYDGPHGPYRPPLEYLWQAAKNPGALSNWRTLLYSGEILYHDAYIKHLLDYLSASGLDNDTVVVFTSDHGVAFRSQTFDWPTRFGTWKKKTVRFHSHGVSVTPDDLHVPLLIHDGRNARNVQPRVQLLDLAPTLLSYAGVAAPGDFRGKNLMPLCEGKPMEELVSFHQGWLNYGLYWKNEFLYIRNTAPRDGFPAETLIPEELYNIKNDPWCKANMAMEESPLLGKMRALSRTIMPAEGQYLLEFLGVPGDKLRVSIKNAQGSKILAAELTAGSTCSFIPYGGFTIQAAVNGKPLKNNQILCGKLGLPLLENNSVRPGDLYAVSGWPQAVDAIPKPALILGTVSPDKKAARDLKRSPKQLKAMLEEWGYINQ